VCAAPVDIMAEAPPPSVAGNGALPPSAYRPQPPPLTVLTVLAVPIVPTALAALTYLLTAAVVSALAWRTGSLTAGGAWAAGLVGVLVLWGTGWAGGAVLLAFFLGSVLLELAFPSPPTDLDFRGSRRDARQVLANGAAAAAGAVLARSDPGLGFAALTAALAAAAGDTWATTVGKARGGTPRDILRGGTVPAGASGGVTWAGTLGGVAGSAVVAGVGWLVTGAIRLAILAMVVGSAAVVLDSVLGASLQGKYRCHDCGAPAETDRHRCGGTAALVRGVRWLDNDGVNALATVAAAIAAILAWR